MLDKQIISLNAWGAKGTAESQYRPYAVAEYVSGLSHLNEKSCEALEQRWKKYVHESMRGGTKDEYTWVMLGDCVAQLQNESWFDKEEDILGIYHFHVIIVTNIIKMINCY
jgi:hypothetical protein